MKLASLAKKTDPVTIQTKGKATAEIPPFADLREATQIWCGDLLKVPGGQGQLVP